METKSFTITEEAYERLRAHKRAEENFTEVILRLTRADRDVMAGFGTLSDLEGFGEAVEGTRTALDADLEQCTER